MRFNVAILLTIFCAMAMNVQAASVSVSVGSNMFDESVLYLYTAQVGAAEGFDTFTAEHAGTLKFAINTFDLHVQHTKTHSRTSPGVSWFVSNAGSAGAEPLSTGTHEYCSQLRTGTTLTGGGLPIHYYISGICADLCKD